MTTPSWKELLKTHMPADWADDIDVFETELNLRKQNKLEEKLFAETRLRRGAYGQRYDNGQRYDGATTQTFAYPSGTLTKGPDTLWDAPGMQRIKVPYGGLSAKQLELLADVAEEYSDAILHVTTRQDFQLHFVHIDDTPDLLRRLAAVGLTCKEACGNSVRNITACPYAGVCHDEAFDTTPYANALMHFLLGHPDTQDFGRKFKIAFSGCADTACALVSIHDMGAIAKVRMINGQEHRGFEIYVGGGLGAVPQKAQLLDEFLPADELLPLAQAISRVFGRLGEKKNRARARIKFLVSKIGIDQFKRLVTEERAMLRADPRWTAYLKNLHVTDEHPLREAHVLDKKRKLSPEFIRWRASNVITQRQPGYVLATIKLPLGDLSSTQARKLADLARRYTGDTMRTTVEQNIVFRWISEADLPDFYEALNEIHLAEPGAGTISDITACPGTDTCKLGISSSRGLAAELRQHLGKKPLPIAREIESLHVKTSGCFNSCAQHHIADIGFLGVSRNVKGRRVPHFQLVVGGEWTNNAGSVGLAVGAIPSKNVPQVLDRVTSFFVTERRDDESFQDFIRRIGKARVRELIKDLLETPDYALDPSYYSDWGDPREYTIGDMGVGECAGEIVPAVQFGLVASERQVYQAQALFDKGDLDAAVESAYKAMLEAARALTRAKDVQTREEPDEIIRDFRTHLCDTKLFYDPYAGDKFASYLFETHEARGTCTIASLEQARQRVEQAQLFLEAAHACSERILQTSN